MTVPPACQYPRDGREEVGLLAGEKMTTLRPGPVHSWQTRDHLLYIVLHNNKYYFSWIKDVTILFYTVVVLHIFKTGFKLLDNIKTLLYASIQ